MQPYAHNNPFPMNARTKKTKKTQSHARTARMPRKYAKALHVKSAHVLSDSMVASTTAAISTVSTVPLPTAAPSPATNPSSTDSGNTAGNSTPRQEPRTAGMHGRRHHRKNTPLRAKKSLIDILGEQLTKIGIEESPRVFNTRMLRYTGIGALLLSITVLIFIIVNDKPLSTFFIFLFFIWTIVFGALYLLISFAVLFYFDMIMYRRVKQIEEALPDFLQLTAANISAGMTIDRALWYAVRPKFGILAKEMEHVAKSTLTGEDLEVALVALSKKYDSRLLRESVNLIVAGINSGGEMADLLNKIASNIKDTELMRKEISANVTTYVIFIGAATIFAAPILFALSTELLIIIKEITSKISIDHSAGLSSLFTFNFSGDSIAVDSFRRFAILILCISSFFSAAIISVIRTGTVKAGLKSVPIFIAVSLILYFFFTAMFASMLGGLF